jgi:heparin/heparan-sulfate lyase
MKAFVRQFVFIQPNVIVVFDRVESSDPGFKKTWLLHSVEEPKVASDSSSIEMSYKDGRLVTLPLLPLKEAITKIGGPGNEFLVAGVHYATGPKASSGRFADLDPNEIPGAWRIEECPSTPSAEDYFLNMMLVTDRGATTMPEAKLDNAADGKSVAVTVSVPGGRTATLTFAKGETPGASIKVEEGGKVLCDEKMPTDVVLEDGRLK